MTKVQGKNKQHRVATSKKMANRGLFVVLSSFRVISWRWLVVTSVVSVIGLALLQVPRFLQQFPIETVEIEGTLQFVDRIALKAVVSAHTDSDNKRNYFNIDLAQLRSDTQALPWVESVDVRKVWPNTLQIIIEERVAIAIWQDTQLISHKGDLFYPEKMLESTALPRLYGPSDKARYIMDNFHQMSNVLRRTQLRITDLKLADRLAWRLKLNNQIEVMIDKEQAVEKLLRFVDLYAQLIEKQYKTTEKKIAKVDLRYSNGIAVTWDDA